MKRRVVVARVILKDSKLDLGLGPGVIGEADVHVPETKSALPLAATLAYAESEVIAKFIEIKWEAPTPKKGKRTDVRPKRARRQ